MLNADKNHLQQRHAAWAIGTGIKNSYDFQLWLLESDYTHPSKLILKTNNKKDKDYKYDLGNDVKDIDVNTESENNNSDIENKEKNNSVKSSKINNSNYQNNNALSISVQNINKTSVLFVEEEKNKNIIELDSKKSNDNKVDLNQHMTGLEKLVSLLHYSSIVSRSNDTSVENMANMDELQRKVLYAISAAARGNIDIQNALLEIKKENLYDIESYVIQNDEIFDDNYGHNDVGKSDRNDVNSHDLNTDNTDSIFLNYLIDIANNKLQKKDNKYSNNVLNDIPSFDIIRKVWGFIADMLQERAYIKGDLMQLADLPESAMKEISSLKLFGDIFLNQNWFDLASKKFEIIYSTNLKDFEVLDIITEIEIDNNGEIENGDFEGENMILLASEKSRKRNVKATLESILVVLQEIVTQNDEIRTSIISDKKDSSNSLIVLLTKITNLNEFKNKRDYKNEDEDEDEDEFEKDYNEGFVEKAKKLLSITQQ